MTRISIFLITIALIAGMVGCGDTNGPDPYGDYIKIYDWTGLDNIRDNLAATYVLMNDLDSSTVGYEEMASPTANGEKGWQPIGSFDGTLDGQGYEIRNLFIDRFDEDYVGLFGYVAEGGTIEDIGVSNIDVTGYHYVGGLVGFNDGTLSDSYSIGSVNGEEYFGGLVGYDSGNTVGNSYYNHDESLINGGNMITTGALSDEDFEEWLANSKFLDISERLSEENGYYLIESVSDFKELLAFGQNATLKFRLINDLDLSGEPNFYIPYFAGEFDGDGHIISNLSLNLSEVSNLGLFGYLIPGGIITGVGVENVNITGRNDIGGLVGHNRGTVSDSYSTGSVTGNGWLGNLVGTNFGTVSNSYSTGSVDGINCVGILVGYNDDYALVTYCYSTGGNTTGNSVGGVVGWNCGTVTYCYSTGNVAGDSCVGGVVGYNNYGTVTYSYSTGNVASDDCVGGVVGYNNEGSVSNSYSTGNVTGKGPVGGIVGRNDEATVADCYFIGSVTGEGQVGGLVGQNWDIVRGCYSTGNVTGNSRVGGLVGDNGGTVENSYATGSVTGWGRVGGLVGDNTGGTVENSYATGSVTGMQWVGGLVGSCFWSTVSSCYAIGNVTGEYDFVGGLVGFNDCSIVSSSFWDMETSGQTTSAGGTGKTTAEMKNNATFSGAAWSIIAVANPSTRNPSYIWNIVNNVTYPFLSWQSVS